MRAIPTVLVYARRDDEVLLMHRQKEPNLGLWVAPGGKLEPGESPHDAARRELAEEAGLTLEVDDLELRAICTETSPRPDWQWFLFIFVTDRVDGPVRATHREGELAWVSLTEYFTTLNIPPADAIFAPQVLGAGKRCFQAKFVYDEQLKLVEWIEY
jgi:ADP-ribose pyrophosphatase YjhB (NUDIX family)